MSHYSKEEQAAAILRLRDWLKPGDTVWCVLRHVSRSDMLRVISFHTIPADPDCARILDASIAQALNMTWDRQRQGVKVGGCGMDMGFHVVYNISRTLWPDGYECTGEGCAFNDHSNGDRNYTPHQHSDGGYALKHRWL